VNVVDSSGWLEYLAEGPNADFFAPSLVEVEALLVPTIAILEVGKVVHRQRDEQAAIQTMALMEQGTVIQLDAQLARSAVALAMTYRLPLADSIILATARAFNAVIWTQDSDFKGIPGVQYIEKVRPSAS
jgi:predicted nucleic acid-binding protein